MFEVQKFALNNIHCSPPQDRQYRFKLVRVTNPTQPASRSAFIYGKQRTLPNKTSLFQVYVIGAVPPTLLNLVEKGKTWVRDVWRNVALDMNSRNYIMQFYDINGVVFPRKDFYYLIGRSGELIIAAEISSNMKQFFKVEDCAYMRVYSNEYFNSPDFEINTPGRQTAIQCGSRVVANNLEKLELQTTITQLEVAGGKAIVYVNGRHAPGMTLSIPNDSFVEFVYDRSILGVESYPISGLRTFHSTKDNRVKYFLYRNRVVDHIQYEDDLEVYVCGERDGLFYYQHKQHALTNVTDKDFGLDAQYVNAQANVLSTLVGGSVNDKTITLYTRRSSIGRKLVNSSLKLHELYKLPADVQKDVLLNHNHSVSDFRVENLEDSDYFKVVSATSLSELTKELTSSAVGYAGLAHYYGETPVRTGGIPYVKVPPLYQDTSLAYEYDASGNLIDRHNTVGPSYAVHAQEAASVEFVQGRPVTSFKLYNTGEEAPVPSTEYRVVAALYDGPKRLTNWTDVTDQATVSGNSVTLNDSSLGKFRVLPYALVYLYDVELAITDGVLFFPINTQDDRGDGETTHRLDIPFVTAEVFLNNRKLVEKIDYFMDFPNILICNKTYLKYGQEVQRVHVRLTGLGTAYQDTNKNDITGFVNNGVLTRNKYYDITDDKVLTISVNGKLTHKDTVKFSEADNTTRIGDALNGLPYSITERQLSLMDITGISTPPLLAASKALDARISSLFNQVFPEPSINPFNVIGSKHYLYSPVVSKVICDLKEKNIPPSLYTTPYNDTTIQQLLNTTYQPYHLLDPIRASFPANVVEIHPHIGNDTIDLNLFQYRFVVNLIRILTQGHPERINLSGYVTVSVNDSEEVVSFNNGPGGVVVL